MSQNFSPDQFFHRQQILAEIGKEGQQRLQAAKILIVGLGGLGTPAALYLSSCGIGTLGLADFDTVDISNLHRQILYGINDVGAKKIDATKDRLAAAHPFTKFDLHPQKISHENVIEIIKNYDLILDGTDQFDTRYLLNDACYFADKPLLSASVSGFKGMLALFQKDHGCYRCLFPQMPAEGTFQNCAEAGILGTVPGILGLLQAHEAILYLLGKSALQQELIHLDLMNFSLQKIHLKADPHCPLCGNNKTIHTLPKESSMCSTKKSLVSVAEAKARHDEFTWIDVRNPDEYAAGFIPGATLIPLPEIDARAAEVPQDKPVMLYCKRGRRAEMAYQALSAKGFTNLFHMEQGYDDYVTA